MLKRRLEFYIRKTVYNDLRLGDSLKVNFQRGRIYQDMEVKQAIIKVAIVTDTLKMVYPAH